VKSETGAPTGLLPDVQSPMSGAKRLSANGHRLSANGHRLSAIGHRLT
jgi:hypothetical protein